MWIHFKLNTGRSLPRYGPAWGLFAASVFVAFGVREARSVQPPPAPAEDRPRDSSPAPRDLLVTAKLPSPEQAKAIEQAIQELGSPKFDRRETASRRLILVGATAIPLLHSAYVKTQDFEVRVRIQIVVNAVYLEENLYLRNAFLGVSMGGMGGRTNLVTHAMDPRVPKDGHGIVIGDIVSGTAAQSAGLRPNDVIVLLDGAPVRGTQTVKDPSSFSEILRNKGVGNEVRLTVLRDAETLEIPVILGQRPRDLYNERDQPDFAREREEVERGFRRWWREVFTHPDAGKPAPKKSSDTKSPANDQNPSKQP